MNPRRIMLPLWVWLALAFGALAGLPPLCNWGVAQGLALWQQQAIQAHLAAVRRVVGTNVTRWHDSTWQRHAGSAFTALGVDVVLVDHAGIEYATNRAVQLQRQTTAVQHKFRLALPRPLSTPWQTVMVVAPTRLTTHRGVAREPAGVAYLWLTQPVAGVPPPWAASVAGAIALVLILTLVAWFLLRWVVRPLAAMSRAAQRIATGHLDIRLPSSQTREVAEVAAALTVMSAALHTAQERQAALEEERRLFIGAIAHDLRTPLFALRGYLTGLESGVVATPEQAAHYVHAARGRADALEKLIAELFAYARVEYLEQAPCRDALELGALVQEVVDGIQPAAAAKDICLTLQEAPVACPLSGDARLLGRALHNVLDNALRHTPAGGYVYVRWRRAGAGLIVELEDTGPGLDPPELPHLFTPLYRAEPSRNRQTGGAGLGLSIARRILQAHGGNLTATNAAHGGALFTATLPAADAPTGADVHPPLQPVQ